MPNWANVFNEIQQAALAATNAANGAADTVRRKYVRELHTKTQRNVIAYYSAWLSKPGLTSEMAGISDEDKNGFMMAVHGLKREAGLDLILHTPGGNLHATQSIVAYLRKMFGNNIRAIVPQIAMSAGTMIACSCRSIMMAKHSNLGPIDPQILGRPAAGVLDEFERAYREIKKDPSRANVWRPILAQYPPTYLRQCEHGVKWAKEFVRDELATCMLSGRKESKKKAAQIVRKLSDYSGNKSHARHIHIDECRAMGLSIEEIEQDADLQDLILTVHHCYTHATANTPIVKIIENHAGAAWAKQAQPLQRQ